MPLIHLASRILGTPLLIARPKLDVILSVLGSRIGLPNREMAFPIPEPKQARAFAQSGIAVIPVFGTLVKRSLGLDAASGLMAYDELESRLETALADPQVAGILLDLDSPGGEASGVFELAERIRAASTIKPIWAHANDAAYSAAYAIAAACQRLTLSQTAGVGSIGVIALHVDQSVKDAKDGLNYTAIFAGSHKNDFSPHEPLTPQATTALQAEVDRLYDIFVNQVGQMRGVDPDAVRATEAAVYFGENAVVAGLADAVMPFDQAVREFADALATQRSQLTPQARSAALPRASPPTLHHAPRSTSLTSEHIMNEQPDEHVTLDPLHKQHEQNDPADPAQPAEQSQDEGDPQPTPAAQAALAQSFASGRSQAQAIAELCLIAGQPQRTAQFLAAGFSEAQVRRALLETKADQPEIASRITADAGTSPRPEHSPVVAAVKKLTAKE